MKNTAPYSAADRKKIAALPDENGREANSPIGSIGSAARRSHSTNATASSAPTASAAITSTLPQPAELPRTSPHTSPSAAPVTSARPAMSGALRGP